MNKNFGLSQTVCFMFLCLTGTFAQETVPAVSPKTPAQLSEIVSKNLENRSASEVPRERSEAAFAKLLEAQRFMWALRRSRSNEELNKNAKQAREALRQSVELDPMLAEAYTTLAELATLFPVGDPDDAILLAGIAAKISPDNFGARRLLARLYSLKSGIASPKYDSVFGEKAVAEWIAVTRLDPRNAEAWGFLAEFYDYTKKNEERVDALRHLLASSAPLETGFYRRVFGSRSDLSPESALPKLASALIQASRFDEGIEILCRAINEAPDDQESVNLLREVLESNDKLITSTVIEALQRAVFSNLRNAEIIRLFVDAHRPTGRVEEAVRVLQVNAARVSSEDKDAISKLNFVLGETLFELRQFDVARASFDTVLRANGVGSEAALTEEQRDTAMLVFERMIALEKGAERFDEAKAVIKQARSVLGDDDPFADRALINLLRETNQRQSALAEIRSLRKRFPEDMSLMRLEAQTLAETGRINEAAAMVGAAGKTSASAMNRTASTQKFSDLIFLAGLYAQAKRGKLGIAAAQQALSAAEDNDQKLTAKFALANAYYESGDSKSAEETLREILKSSPRNPVAMNNLGYYLLERNASLEEAHSLISEAVKIDPTNPNYLDSLGWANFKLGKLDEAERNLKYSLRYDNFSAVVHEHLGDVYWKQSRREQAIRAWQKSLSLMFQPKDIVRLKAKISSAKRK